MTARTIVTLLMLLAAAGCGEPPPTPPSVSGRAAPAAPAAPAAEPRPPREHVTTATPPVASAAVRPTDPEIAALLDDVLGPDPDARTTAARELRLRADGAEVLAWLLGNGLPEVRLLAARSLSRMGERARAALPSLLRAARAGDDEFRVEVITALGTLQDARAVPVLVDLLHDPVEDVLQQVVISLGEFGPRAEAALPRLVELLGEEPSWVADRAAETIARLGPAGEPAIPALVAQFDADEGAGTQALLEALMAFGPAAEAAVPAVAREIVRHERNKERTAAENPEIHVSWIPISMYAEDTLVAVGEASIPQLVDLLGDEMWEVQRRAAEALRRLGAPARPVVAAALSDENAHRRAHAAEVLAQIAPDDPEALAGVVRLLSDPDEDVRRSAANEMHRFGPAAVPHLAGALSDPAAAWAAARSLGRLGPAAAPAVPELERAMASGSSPLRRYAAAALGRIGAAALGSAPSLARALDDDAADLREEAAGALSAIGPGAVPVLLDVLQHGSERAQGGAATALAGMEDGSAVVADALLEALATAEPEARWRVALALSRTRGHAEQVVPALRAGLQYPDTEHDVAISERLAAVARALGSYDAAGAVALPDLIAAMRRFRKKAIPGGYVPLWAQIELASVNEVIGQFAARDDAPVVALLSDDDEYMRRTGRDALVAAGPSVVPQVIQVARGGSPVAQLAAVGIIGPLAEDSVELRAELAELMRMNGDARRVEAAKWYYHATQDAGAVVPLLLDIARSSEDADARESAAAFVGLNVKAAAAFAIKEIRALHAATRDPDVKRCLGYAIENVDNR